MTDGRPDEAAGEHLDPDDPYRYGRPDDAPPPGPGYQHPPPVDGWVAYPPPPAEDERARRYGPSPYASVPPPGHDPGGPTPSPGSPATPGTRTATTALVLGLASLPGAFFAYLDVVPVLLAVFFGLKVLNEGRSGRSNAIAALVAAGLGGIFAIVVSVQLTRAVDQCGGWSNAKAPSFQQCVQDRL